MTVLNRYLKLCLLNLKLCFNLVHLFLKISRFELLQVLRPIFGLLYDHVTLHFDLSYHCAVSSKSNVTVVEKICLLVE